MWRRDKGQRLPEQLFKVVMWVIALLFAGFLTGLGGLLIGDLPRAEPMPPMSVFESAELKDLRAQQLRINQKNSDVSQRLEQARLAKNSAQTRYEEEKQGFDAWLQTRSATGRAEQDPQVVERTKKLDELRLTVSQASQAIEKLEQELLNNEQAVSQDRMQALEADALKAYEKVENSHNLKVFLWRLLFTLPALVLAAWLFVKKRDSRYWPFVWGFIFFALFAFFVELVPYLPSYGGYVRYIVGLIGLGLGGYFGIQKMQAYLLRKQAEEQAMLQSTQEQRRQAFTYEQALSHLAKGVCPSCERTLNTSQPSGLADYCVHCGLCAYKNCRHCGTRCSTFFKFCSSCGETLQAHETPKTEAI